ncbi:M20 family metallopeptidase [Nocardia carnea]|uniref:M20 family metallopeptidase n=1 Tax=Nocardia carnea TaxID=37328 RepID=UPI00245387FF|nr:M20 family metallopeptidase [Nocardia carnea]
MTEPVVPTSVEVLHRRVSPHRVAELTASLIRCDTSNPPGGEQSIIPVLTDVLVETGCSVEVFETTPGRPSLVAKLGPADGTRPILMFNGHIDVVPARRDEWEVDPFGGVVEEDRVRGRGACDMKGGIAAVIEALTVCNEAGARLDSDIVLHLVADEETGGAHGTEALADAGLIEADACIIPEPTEMQIGIAERGCLVADIFVYGRAAHASDPALGHSAIMDAARVVAALHLADFGEPGHPLLGRPSCNAGTISGGTSANVVASECVVRIDRRTLPGDSREHVLKSITDELDRLSPKIDYRIEPYLFVEASEIRRDAPFVRYLQHIASGRNSSPAEVQGSYLGSDARTLRNRLGIPTVLYGPGSVSQAHTPDEWVMTDDLVAIAKSFVSILTTFGTRSSMDRAADGRMHSLP